MQCFTSTNIGATTNRVIYQRRINEDLKVVPYTPKLTGNFKSHINVDCTQGDVLVSYRMKYTLKGPNGYHSGKIYKLRGCGGSECGSSDTGMGTWWDKLQNFMMEK